MTGFCLFLSSDDSKHMYPSNTFHDFTVEFDRQIELEQWSALGWKRQWTFALTDISIDHLNVRQTIPESVVVLCDLAEPSYINSTQASVIRTLDKSGEVSIAASLHNIFYVGVNKVSFNKLRICLRNRQLEALTIGKGWEIESELKCTLHFQRE